MPIGLIAGQRRWMDALDGGMWQFGDDSRPEAGVTYFAGTFVRHPLTMAAVRVCLEKMLAEGPGLQRGMAELTAELQREINEHCEREGVPLEVRRFTSLFKPVYTEPVPHGELLFCILRDLGVHIWDGFPCFLSAAHGEAEVAFIVDAFKKAIREMQAGAFLPRAATGPAPAAGAAGFDPAKPPVPGARLGRDRRGNPAWFVPSDSEPGKYVPVKG